MHFDYVSGQGVSKNAATLDNGELNALLWRKCNLSVEGEREQSLTPEKQMMRLRMLAPLLAVNSTQVSTHSVAGVILKLRSSRRSRSNPFALFSGHFGIVRALLHLQLLLLKHHCRQACMCCYDACCFACSGRYCKQSIVLHSRREGVPRIGCSSRARSSLHVFNAS